MKAKYTIRILFLFLMPSIFISCALMMSMEPMETGQVSDMNIYAIKNGIGNAFLVKANDKYILIDAGSKADDFGISLKEAGIDAVDVKWIFLTHSDRDHVAALPLFPGAEIYMGKEELPLINRKVKRNIFGYNSLPDGIDINRIIPLSNNQELVLNGIKIKCMEASGHTNGSVLYLVDNRYLFTGDAFKIKNGSTLVHPFTMDKKLSEKTIEQYRETILNSSFVFTSHYGIKEK